MKKANKSILHVFTSLILSVLFVYLFGSYLNWDLEWIKGVSEWMPHDRGALALIHMLPFVVFMAIFSFNDC